MKTSPVKHGHMTILHAYISIYCLRNALFVTIPQFMQILVTPYELWLWWVDINSSPKMCLIYDDIFLKDQASTSFYFITSPLKINN